MIHKIMSEEDLACLQEFMDAGNGEAVYEYVDENPGVAGDGRIALLKKSADLGFHLAAEELAWMYGSERGACVGDDFGVQADEAEARKYNELANVLERRWENSNKGRILVCAFDGWMEIRCGGEVFCNSYLFPSFPVKVLQACINRLEKGELMFVWFSDEEYGHDISEEIVDGTDHLFIHWKDDEKKDRCTEFPDFDFARFAAQVADDIESNYFGFAYFMTQCDGIGLSRALKELKQGVAKLRPLLVSESQSMNEEGK